MTPVGPWSIPPPALTRRQQELAQMARTFRCPHCGAADQLEEAQELLVHFHFMPARSRSNLLKLCRAGAELRRAKLLDPDKED